MGKPIEPSLPAVDDTVALFLLAGWIFGVSTKSGGALIHVFLGSALALLALAWLLVIREVVAPIR